MFQSYHATKLLLQKALKTDLSLPLDPSSLSIEEATRCFHLQNRSTAGPHLPSHLQNASISNQFFE